MQAKEELLQKLSDCVFDMEDEEVVDVVKEYIECGYDPQEGMLEGLVDGMKRASAMYEEGEYFVISNASLVMNTDDVDECVTMNEFQEIAEENQWVLSFEYNCKKK